MNVRQRSKKKHSDTTQGQEKMFAYVRSLVNDVDFRNEVATIRKRYSLPPEGIQENIKDELAFIEKLLPHIDERGEEWSFQKEVFDLTSQFSLSLPWLGAGTGYVLYDDFFFARVSSLVEAIDLSEVLVEQEKYDDNPVLDENGEEVPIDMMRNIVEGFPISLLISPYATGRDIVDYVKKRYKDDIEPMQLKHREAVSRIGSVRKRNKKTQERDEFIFSNRNLRRKQIAQLISDKYGVNLDYTYISKIIAKKRKRGK